VCSVCGTTLTDVPVVQTKHQPESPPTSARYDYHFGDSDLFEGDLRWKTGNYLMGAIFALLLAAIVVAGVMFIPDFVGGNESNGQLPAGRADSGANIVKDTPTPQISPTPIAFVTNTPAAPTPILNTVTPLPTATDTPAPCIQNVNQGDDLISLVFRCGHRDLAVIDIVLQENNLSNASLIQVGQQIVIPWPTPTVDPNVTPTTEVESDIDSDSDTTDIAAESVAVAQRGNVLPGLVAPDVGTPVIPTATLPPGVIWHDVVFGEDIISIAFQYGADVEILSQLNPEVTFSQCDFGIPTGGPNCIVQIFEGQRLRVPAPTQTPTIPPTPSGSETPTPTATPTINVPSALSPVDRSFFRADEIITLRWVTTGTLGPDEVYRVVVTDTTTDTEYSGDTQDLFFIVPQAWQGTDGERHRYTWSVNVINEKQPDDPIFSTQLLSFVWESREGDES